MDERCLPGHLANVINRIRLDDARGCPFAAATKAHLGRDATDELSAQKKSVVSPRDKPRNAHLECA